MNIEEIRRSNMQILAAEFGGVGKLAELLERDQSQVSQWMHGAKNSGTGKPRGMRPDSCRYIERKCNKPAGWMDTNHMDGDKRIPDDFKIWPFQDLSYEKVLTLSERQRIQLETAVLLAATDLGLDVAKNIGSSRQQAQTKAAKALGNR